MAGKDGCDRKEKMTIKEGYGKKKGIQDEFHRKRGIRQKEMDLAEMFNMTGSEWSDGKERMTGREEYDRTGGIDRKLGIYCKRKGVLFQERSDMAETCGFGSKIGI
jgi:hypothetical protein